MELVLDHIPDPEYKEYLEQMEYMRSEEKIPEQQRLLRQKREDELKLIQKHEKETQWLAESLQSFARQLATKQRIEMFTHLLKTEKILDGRRIEEDPELERAERLISKRIEESEKKLSDLQRLIDLSEKLFSRKLRLDKEELEEIPKVKELLELQSSLQNVKTERNKLHVEISRSCILAAETMQALDRHQAHSYIEARIEETVDLGKPKQSQPRVGVRMAGSIDESPWVKAFQKEFPNDEDRGLKRMKQELAHWQEVIGEPKFYPSKVVPVGRLNYKKSCTAELQILPLKEKFGDEVYNSVKNAAIEIDWYTYSRVKVPIAWNFDESREASLTEIMAYFKARFVEMLSTLRIAESHQTKSKSS